MYLGERIQEGLLLDNLLLQSARDQLLSQPANLKTFGDQIRVQEGEQHEKSNDKRTRYGDFEVDRLLIKCCSKQNREQPDAHQNACKRNNSPKLPITLFQPGELLSNASECSFALFQHWNARGARPYAGLFAISVLQGAQAPSGAPSH